MLVEEVVEGVSIAFGRQGNKVVKKYRCTSGPRKGRLVAKAATCTAPKNVSKSVSLKKTKAKKSSQIKTKTRITKRSNPASIRSRRINRSRSRSSRRSSKGKRI